MSGMMPMTPPGSMPNDTMNMSMKDMAMHMSFYWGKDAIILFQGWPNHSLGMYILSLFFVLFLSLAVEVLSVSPAAKPVTQATAYCLRTALAYMVMLSVMSFNIGIFLAAVVGHTIGFFIVRVRALAADKEAEATTPKV